MTDFTLPAHVCKLWLVRVTDTAGQVLPPGGFDFYGCAMAPGGRAVAMVAEVRGDATELVLPGLCAPGAWDLSIFCREVATGVTWAVQQGRVNVTPAPVLAGVAPAREELVAVLDRVTQELRVELGDSTASAAENARLAVAAREGADEAAERAAADAARVEELKRVTLDVAAGAALAAERAEDSKRGAQAAAGDAADDARVAEAKAAEAEASRVAAEAAQRQAEAKAAEAEAGAKVAAEAVSDALAARDEAVAAQVVAEDASAQAGRYAAQAVGAADGAVVAEAEAKAAKDDAVLAKDGAVLAAAEAKAAEAGAAGAADAVRFDLLPVTMDWLDSRFTKTLGEGKFSMTYTEEENMLRVAFALETTEAQIAESRALLDRVLPRNLVTEIDPFPCDFTRVEYLEVGISASYQRFVLDKTVDSSVGMRVKHKDLENSTRNFVYALIYQPSGSTTFSGLRVGSAWMAMSSTAGAYDTRSISPPLTEPFDVTVYNFKGDRKYGTNGVFATGQLKALKLPVIIDKLAFGSQYDAYRRSYREFFYKGRYYEIEVSRDAEIDVHLLPALDTTGAPCMYDTVTRTPFYNSGTGDFLYPTESTTYSWRRVLPDWGKLTPTGLRRLYHAPAGYEGDPIDYALENGFKPIIEPDMPEEGYWTPVWHDRDDCIELEWVETEPPMEETLTETE